MLLNEEAEAPRESTACKELAALVADLRKKPVGFDSFRFRTFRRLIGSVRFVSEFSLSWIDAVWPAFFGRVVARSGSVRFRVRFQPVP